VEQKKLCLYTGSSFPSRYINFKINFFLTASCCPWLAVLYLYFTIRFDAPCVELITGSPAGLSRVNGFRRSSVQTWNFNPSNFKFGEGDYVREVISLPNVVRTQWAVETPRGGNIFRYCDFLDFFLFFVFFILQQTRKLIFEHNSSKDAVWYKEDPFWDENCVVLNFGGCFTQQYPKMGRKGQLAAKIKLRNGKRYAKYINEPRLWNWGRSFKFRQQKLCETPPGGEITLTSFPVCNKTSLSRKPCIPDKKLLWNAIRKSWSLFQNPSWKIAWNAS